MTDKNGLLLDTVYSTLKKLCARAGVPDLGTHVCRHTFVSVHGANGTPVEVLSAHFGHARPSFTLGSCRSVLMHERQHLTLEIAPLLDDVDVTPPELSEICELMEKAVQVEGKKS